MALEMQNKNKSRVKSTQSFLRLSEIKNDCVVMGDGTLRAVLAVSSTNFDLKSQEEQNAIIFGFQRFLNSLEFSIQILMQSRKMEVSSYIEKLKRMAEKQPNELLRVQTNEYVEFISRLIENASIMNKNFYVIVPLGESITPSPVGFFSRLFGNAQAKQASERINNFEKIGEKLALRVTAVQSNLGTIGVKSERLNTEALMQLYYNSYNFESAPLLNFGQLKDIKIVE